jgi:sulfate adenylyltransferase subunit 2
VFDSMAPRLLQLEDESIYVIREAVAQTERVGLLFSGGKDSILLSVLARKAFHPGKLPFPLVHIDTGHNFPETLAYRDAWAETLGATLLVKTVQETIDRGRAVDDLSPNPSRNALQSITLLDTVAEYRFDALLGGARRDEEKARAKERFFSFRNAFGQWDPKNQRPELWNLYNGLKQPGEHFRVFPLSNWTEIDVWVYLARQGVTLPSLYFAHEREVVARDGMLLAKTPFITVATHETAVRTSVRFRTIGDVTCTGAVESKAATVEEVVAEIRGARITERGGRADDKKTDAAMEDRKKEGYF